MCRQIVAGGVAAGTLLLGLLSVWAADTTAVTADARVQRVWLTATADAGGGYGESDSGWQLPAPDVAGDVRDSGWQ